MLTAALFCAQMYAATGDTTTVQTFSGLEMNKHGNYDTTIEFPDGSKTYRKVLMTFTLGKRKCAGYNPNNAGDKPGQTGWCGDWDYTVQNFLMTKSGDVFELGRYITPYARENAPRTPTSWTQRYVWDVTDFYPILKDSATFRINYSGYSWGFTADVKFEFIEGTPPRNVLGIEKVWGGSSRFGDTSQATQIEDRVDTKSLTAPTNTKFAELTFNVSGHGNDDNNCCEFNNKFYEVELNNVKFDKTQMWRDDCGANHLYPQSGTWLLNRTNWCPGDIVFTNVHKLAGITGGSNFDLDVDFENYIGKVTINGRSWGSFIYQGNVFYYDAFNKSVDASLEDIIAPSTHETHFRRNPVTGHPTVKIRNTGSTTITTVKFKYELQGGTGQKEYTWSSTLNSLESAEINFPPFYDLGNVTTNGKFNVEIAEVNGSADADASNNKMSSDFEPAVTYDTKMIFHVQANNVPGEVKWKITDMFNNHVVAERTADVANKLYSDTVSLGVAMYKLEVIDVNCDGLSWWAFPGAGSGKFYVTRMTSGLQLPLKGYFGGDFGCGFTQYFNVKWPTGVVDNSMLSQHITAYPNPASNELNIGLGGFDNVDGVLRITDMTGRVVYTQAVTAPAVKVNVSGLSNGVYTVSYFENGNEELHLMTRVMIAK